MGGGYRITVFSTSCGRDVGKRSSAYRSYSDGNLPVKKFSLRMAIILDRFGGGLGGISFTVSSQLQ